MRRFHIVGIDHTDLAWRGDRAQYAAYLEQFTVILLDLMEQFPDLHYVIEQAYQYRELEKQRPDLIERLKKHIAAGRIEVMGGMVSTADSNMPSGESNVRNLLLGQRWFKEHLNAEIQTAWLFDAFGISAQMPQVLASFGQDTLIASRFGGDKHHDVFYAEGLDGTKLLVAGRDCFSPNLPDNEHSRVFLDCVITGALEDELFAAARKAKQDGPLLIGVYIEDEIFPSRRMVENGRALKKDMETLGDQAEFSLPHRFFEDLKAHGGDFPIESADLNPEFTGTFSQRVEIRLQNRRTENLLLDAEKWLALCGKPRPQALRDAWWDMGFVQFHDVFTGSHPESVFRDVMARLEKNQKTAQGAMEDLFGGKVNARALPEKITVVNSLPFARRDWAELPVAEDTGVTVYGEEGEVPSYIENGRLHFAAETGPCACSEYRLVKREKPSCASVQKDAEQAVLENDFLRLTVSAQDGVTLECKGSGTLLLKNAKDLLILQEDTGSFQIENPEGSERHAWAGQVRITKQREDCVTVCGSFENQALWELRFTLRDGEEFLGLQVKADWQAVGQRLRLKLAGTLERAGEGIYEIPFGTVRRRAYTPAFSRKGEWPVQRFAAVEDGSEGLALINTGVPGVEILGSTIYATLLRAPTQTYAGMVPDESSQQHGEHTFTFALYPYAEKWQNSNLLELAQRLNQPLQAFAGESGKSLQSRLAIDNQGIVLSSIKDRESEDRNGIFVRVYEAMGKEQSCKLKIPGSARAWNATMGEKLQEEITVKDGEIDLEFAPWQIRTVYIERV